jgi:hypothetical protein
MNTNTETVNVGRLSVTSHRGRSADLLCFRANLLCFNPGNSGSSTAGDRR